MYYVRGTYRKDSCNDSSPISGLVLDAAYNGFTVHDIESLRSLANAGLLKVYSSAAVTHIPVIIYYSAYYGRYIATTKKDGIECNNLLSLPIFYPASRNGTTTSYSQCSY